MSSPLLQKLQALLNMYLFLTLQKHQYMTPHNSPCTLLGPSSVQKQCIYSSGKVNWPVFTEIYLE